MTTNVKSLRAEALAQLARVTNLRELDAWHSAVLGRKGSLTNLLGTIGTLPREERPAFGQAVSSATTLYGEPGGKEVATILKGTEVKLGATGGDFVRATPNAGAGLRCSASARAPRARHRASVCR